MPIGSFAAIPHVAKQLATQRPARVLDVGIGSGFYGAVVRQWLDEGVRPWRTFLVGVEACASYRNPLWDVYNLVVVDSIQNWLERFHDRFDCIIAGDVLEHFPEEEGGPLLTRLQARLAPGGTLIVVTPAVFVPQGAVYGNEFERHRSLWTAARLEALGFQTVLSGHEPQVAFVPTVLSVWTQSDHRGPA